MQMVSTGCIKFIIVSFLIFYVISNISIIELLFHDRDVSFQKLFKTNNKKPINMNDFSISVI